jgi:hypothetical protein
MDMGSIAALTGSLQAAVEITKGLIGARDMAMIQDKIIELQGVILSAQQGALAAQSSQFSLLEHVRELEQQMTSMKTWEVEKQEYELKDIGSGCFAYMLKPNARGSQPPHWLCAACYEHGRKSILQHQGRAESRDIKIFRCAECKGTVGIFWRTHPTYS